MQSEAALSLSALLGGHDRPPVTGRQRDDDTGDDDTCVPTAAVAALIEVGQRLDRHGWVPATAGNISLRLEDGRIAITSSGCHKGFLTPDDIMLVDAQGEALSPGRPSAETLLHCQIYRLCPAAGAVLHGHSLAATVLSMHRPSPIVLTGYEVLKAFEGVRHHEASIAVPVFDNDQTISRLAAAIEPEFATGMPGGYIIRGHGVYAWGPDVPTALARLEALEFLLACELERTRLR
jgi:methylthioribulose-1-phosphate dehydratase